VPTVPGASDDRTALSASELAWLEQYGPIVDALRRRQRMLEQDAWARREVMAWIVARVQSHGADGWTDGVLAYWLDGVLGNRHGDAVLAELEAAGMLEVDRQTYPVLCRYRPCA
jgi:hypothetical protein